MVGINYKVRIDFVGGYMVYNALTIKELVNIINAYNENDVIRIIVETYVGATRKTSETVVNKVIV